MEPTTRNLKGNNIIHASDQVIVELPPSVSSTQDLPEMFKPLKDFVNAIEEVKCTTDKDAILDQEDSTVTSQGIYYTNAHDAIPQPGARGTGKSCKTADVKQDGTLHKCSHTTLNRMKLILCTL